jgi:uncharacterized LabA/DUF88 family protein
MNDIKYLFIDGANAQNIYSTAMNAVFGVVGELSIPKIVEHANPFRTYYYDCLDDSRKDRESGLEFDRRLQSQETYYEKIRSLRGVHLQLGTLTGSRRGRQKEARRQKEVDVLLSVDMLTHGFNRNMSRAILLSGDLDFRPVVEALVRGGVFVEVWYEKTTGSKELYWAADLGRPLDWNTLYVWSTDAFLAEHRLPEGISTSSGDYLMVPQIGSGTFQGGNVDLLSSSDRGPFILHATRPNGNNGCWKHTDRNVLLAYFSAMHGPVVWKSLRERQ